MQVPGLGDSRDEKAVGTIPFDGGALLVALVKRLLVIANRIRKRDLAVGDEGKAAGGTEEGLGGGIGAGHIFMRKMAKSMPAMGAHRRTTKSGRSERVGDREASTARAAASRPAPEQALESAELDPFPTAAPRRA